MRIIVKNAFVETHHFIELIERYHESLRRAYNIITVEISEIESQLTLQMTFKTLNDSARSNDLVSTLLMFDVYSRMIEANALSSTITQRATVMRKIMNEIRRLHAFRQMNDALNTRNDSFIISIHDLLINFSVLVFREDNTRQSETWKRSYKLLSLQDESTVVELSSEFIKFRIISIKSYHNSVNSDMKKIRIKRKERTTMTQKTSSSIKNAQIMT